MQKSLDQTTVTTEDTAGHPGNTRALAELIGLACELNSADSIDGLLDSFARGLSDIWPGAGVRLCEVNTPGKCLIPLDRMPSDPIPIRGTLLGNIAKDGRVTVVADLDDDPAYFRGKEAPPGLTWKSAIGSPIPLNGEASHVVCVFLPERTPITVEDESLLERAVLLLEPLLARWRSQDERLKAFYDIAKAIAAAVDARDPHLVGHGSRVSEFAQHTARVHGLKPGFIERIGLAGLLHDIGRLGIPEVILSKPGILSAEEQRIVRAHPELSVKFLEDVEYLSDVFPAIRNHHERYDGEGYPDGLEGEDIPLGARLLAVADSFDAMTSARAFRGPVSDEEALDELRKLSGRQFDPILVEAFCRAYEEKLIISQNVLSADDPLSQLRMKNIS